MSQGKLRIILEDFLRRRNNCIGTNVWDKETEISHAAAEIVKVVLLRLPKKLAKDEDVNSAYWAGWNEAISESRSAIEKMGVE